ncbi:MAG: DUF3047 domain-containing protein [Brachymonas sp.]|nr:DUF3047 domain-containing protein [Brachymonas sp.]
MPASALASNDRPAEPSSASSLASTGLVLPPWMQAANWQHQSFPGKRRTNYKAQKFQGRDALMAEANASMSVVRKKRRIAAQDLGRVKFSWAAQELMVKADIAQRDAEDAKLRVVLVFEGDRSRFSAKNQMLSDLSQALTGEELPYATLMYVWSNQHPVGSVVHNPRTDRIRKMVVESGGMHLGQWREYERDISADFERAFGEKPGALLGVALMTDSDNTQSRIKAWYGSLQFASIKP